MIIRTHDLKQKKKTFIDMDKLRVLNRRHASLIALSKELARIIAMDSFLMIETERLLLLSNIFIKVNLAAVIPVDWHSELIGLVFYSYR